MFIAQIRNKLTRQEEQMEDLLTSNVFGLWRYLPAELGLLQLLETAKNCEGQGIPMPYEVAVFDHGYAKGPHKGANLTF
jgi:hypothetical protein